MTISRPAAPASLPSSLPRTPLRRAAETLVEDVLARSRRAGRTAAVLVVDVDVDGVAAVDRVLGYETGDEALAQLGARLRAAAPAGAAVAPFVRDRFLLAAAGLADGVEATELAERLAEVVRAPLALGELHVRPVAYVGIGLADAGRGAAAALLRDAGAAADHARETQANPGWLLAAPGLRERELRRLRLADELGDAAPTGGELIGLSAAAAALGVSTSTARRLADEGILPGTRTQGGHRRFRRADVQRIARERGTEPVLRPWTLPRGPLENAAMIFDHEGEALAERAARAIYDPNRPGWFARPQGLARARPWVEALRGALARGTSEEAIAATVAYLDAAALAGASAAECARFLWQLTTFAMHELVRMRAPVEEVRSLQRVTSAASEAFLERLVR